MLAYFVLEVFTVKECQPSLYGLSESNVTWIGNVSCRTGVEVETFITYS